MRHRIFFKMPEEMVNHPGVAANVIKSSIRSAKRKALKRSRRLFFKYLMPGQHGSDLVRCLITVVVEFDEYKIPRIAKNLIYETNVHKRGRRNRP